MSIEKPVKISIVTVCYNAEELIEKTIQSVIGQTYNNVEYVIIDGKSSDKTVDIIRKYLDHIDYFISEKDRGISDAFNKGIRMSSGELICFLNAGDIFISSDILSKVARDYSSVSGIDVLFYKMKYGSTGITPPKKYNDNPIEIWQNMAIPHQACFCRADLFEDIGNFNLLIKIRMDYEFFARCVKLRKKYKYIPEVITIYDDSGVSSTLSNAHRILQEALLVKKMYGFPVSFKEELRCLKWKYLVKMYDGNLIHSLFDER